MISVFLTNATSDRGRERGLRIPWHVQGRPNRICLRCDTCWVRHDRITDRVNLRGPPLVPPCFISLTTDASSSLTDCQMWKKEYVLCWLQPLPGRYIAPINRILSSSLSLRRGLVKSLVDCRTQLWETSPSLSSPESLWENAILTSFRIPFLVVPSVTFYSSWFSLVRYHLSSRVHCSWHRFSFSALRNFRPWPLVWIPPWWQSVISLFIYVYSPFLTLLLSTSDSMAEFQAALNPLILIYLAYIFFQFHS